MLGDIVVDLIVVGEGGGVIIFCLELFICGGGVGGDGLDDGVIVGDGLYDGVTDGEGEPVVLLDPSI